jgi:hypothetical protein
MSVEAFLETQTVSKSLAALEELSPDEVAAILDGLYQPVLKGDEQLPDWRFQMELDKRVLASFQEQASTEDKTRRRSVTTRRGAYRKRNQAALRLRRDIWTIAVKIESHYGRDFLAFIGLAGVRPSNPTLVLDLAYHVVGILRAPAFAFPDVPLEGRTPLNPMSVAAELQAAIRNFEDAIEGTASVAAAAKTALVSKHSTFRWVSFGRRAIIERWRLLLRMAGKDATAKLLAIPKERTRPATDDDTGDPPTGDPPTGDPPTGDPPTV